MIVTTGRTATTVSVSGSVTDITTTSIKAGNAYNDFSAFSTISGSVVNLQVPSTANNLVNIVRDAPAYIGGVLNSYKDGQIGGNVVFVDSYGFVVGQQGVLNVGSLLVRTPTQAFINQLLGPDGEISQTAAEALLKGDIPISPDGRVSIRGHVNAQHNVSLFAESIAIGADPSDTQAESFDATVNDVGLIKGAAIVTGSGGIDIVAAGAVSINGLVSTGAAPGRDAAPLNVTAGGDIQFGSDSVIAAQGVGANSSGGHIDVQGGHDLSIASGALFDSSAGASGDGGQIEISAPGKETLSGGIYDASAIAGKAGAVVFDPALTEISGLNTTVGGTDFVDTAGSIMVDASAIIVTRQVASGADATDPTVASTGNSGNIVLNLTAGSTGAIVINPGAQLLSFATDTFRPGGITLNAGSAGSISFPTDPNFTANAVLATRAFASGTGATLNTGASTGDSGNITLTAGTISLGSGINTAAVANTSAPGEQFLSYAAAANCGAGGTPCPNYNTGSIIFNVASYAFSPTALVLTEGANLVVNATGTVTFPAGSLINSRHQASAVIDTSGSDSTSYFSPIDPTSAILDNPGNVTINAAAISYASGINNTGGAAIYAGGYGGSYGFTPGTITFNIPNFTVTGTLGGAGANLVLNATSGGLTVAAGAVLDTREVVASADATDPTQASKNVSGDLTLTTVSGGAITIGAGAKLLTFSTDRYYAGDIKLLSGGSLIFQTPTGQQSAAELVARSVSSTDAATNGLYAISSANSGNITLQAGIGGSVTLGGGLNSNKGPIVLAGAGAGGTFAYAPGTIKISAPNVSVASGSPLNSLGANLDLEATSGVVLAANAVIDTRDVASGADPLVLANASTGQSGAVTLHGASVTLGSSSVITTSAVGGDTVNSVMTPALPGNVSITAGSTLSIASGAGSAASILARGVAASSTSIASGAADAPGGTISITAPSIDLTNGVNTAGGYVLLAAGGGGSAAGTIALTANSIDLSTTLRGLGANVALTAKTGNVTLENSADIDTTLTNASAGNITVTAASVVLPASGINQAGSVHLVAGATGANTPGIITFSETANLDYTASSLTVATSGAGFVLQTTGALTLGSRLSVDTRDLSGVTTIGPAGDISLIANAITLGSGLNGGGATTTLLAAGGSGFAPGTITLQWTGNSDVTLNSSTIFNSAGANLSFLTAGNLTIADSATLNAGSNTVSLLGHTVQLAPTSTYDAAQLKVGETSASSNFEISSNLAFGGVNLSIATDGSITLDQGVLLSTRKTTNPFAATPNASTGNSGSISLAAPLITVLGTIDAGVTNTGGTTFKAGDVTLTAYQIEQPVAGFGNTTATTAITIGNASHAPAIIKGGNITVDSTAVSDSEPFSTLLTGVFTSSTSALLQSLGQINGSVQIATATSGTHVFGGASISGTGDVVLQAVANTTASNVTPDTPDFINIGLTGGSSGLLPSLPRLVGLPLNSAFSVMEATATSTALVDSGATINAGGTVTVRAHDIDVIHSEESIVSTNNTVDVAVAYSQATINSTAVIDSGAVINAGAVRVSALNTNAWDTTAEVADMGQGKGGIVLALSDGDSSNATALMNASVTLASTLPTGATDGLLVNAQSDTTDNVTTASAESGSGDFSAKALGYVGGTGSGPALASKLNGITGGDLSNVFSNNSSTQQNQIRFAFGVALDIGNTQTATALIGGTTAAATAAGYTTATIAPPTIVSPAGPVVDTANVTDSGLQTQALSTIRSTSYGSAENNANFPGTSYGFGGAVAITDLTHTSVAEVGTQASITAPAVGVDSNIYVPLSLPIADWGTPKAILDNILSFLPTILENSTAEVDTTGANAVANAQQLGVSGSVDIYTLTDHSTAWLGQGSVVTARPAAGNTYLTGTWTTTLDTGDDSHAGIAQPGDSGDPSASWNATVGVTAEDTAAAINIGGGLDFLGIIHPAKSTSSTAGAAFSETNFSQTTVAGIGAGATVNTAGQVDVEATTLDYIITLVPSATNGGAVALSGMVGLSILDNQTDAAISNTADITADHGLTVDAAQYLNSSIVGGALFQKGSTVAFGVGIGINLPTTDTEAFIGDTSSLDPTGAPSVGFTAPTAGVTSPTDNIFGLTSGQVLSLGLAGSLTSSTDAEGHDHPDQTPAASGNGNFSSNPSANGILSKLAVLDNVLPDWPTGPDLPELPQFGFAFSGSAAAVKVALTTKAFVDGATLNDPTVNGTDTVDVSAVRNLWLIAAAGGFAASTASEPQTNVDVAGALALDISNNQTDAYINNSHVLGFGDVQVAALEGGQQIDVAVDLAATLAEGGTAVGVAVSASIGLVNDGVAAYVDGSTITGQGGGVGAVDVTAYNNTNIGLGGGAFTINFGGDGGGSAGAGVTVGIIGDPSTGDAADAHIDNSHVTQFGAVSVDAQSAGRIIMGAVSGSVTDQSTGVGAVTFGQIDQTTNAAITGNSVVSVTNTVNVQANGGASSVFDAALAQYGTVAYSSVSNFSGSQVLSVLDSNSSGPQTAPTQIGTGGAAIIAVAGTFSIVVPSESSEAPANVGLQLTINAIGDTYAANIADSTITTSKTGSVDVAANDSATILGISAGAAVTSSEGANVTGLASVAVNLISDHATATVGDAGGTQYGTRISSGALSVVANNAAITDAFAGNVDISTSADSAAFGAAIAFGEDTQQTKALLTNSQLNVDRQTAVEAATNPVCVSNCPLLPFTIADAAFAVAASGNLSFAGAITANVIENATSATATANSLNDPAVLGIGVAYPATDGSTLVVTGSDNSTIGTFAVSVAGGSTAGVGAGISFGDIANTVSAAIDGNSAAKLVNPSLTADPLMEVGGVLVQATSTPTIETLAAGVGGGETGGIGGSIVTNFVGVDTTQTAVKTATASIDQAAIVSALGNIYVLSQDKSGIEVIAGSLGVSAGGEPGVGIGVGLIVNKIETAATAQIDSSTVDAAGQLTPTQAGGVGSVNDGVLSSASGNAPDVSNISAPTATTYALAENQKTVHGVAVDATADEQVVANTVSIGLQISPEPGLGLGVNALVNLIGGTTTADINNSNIDTTYGAGGLAAGLTPPDVFVNGSSHLFTGNFVIAAAGSLYAAGAAVADAGQISRTTDAYVTGGHIGAVIDSRQLVTNPYNAPCTMSGQASCSDTTSTLTVTTLTPEASIGTVTVNAATTADSADIAIGASAAAGALAGTVIVDIFSPTTNAYVSAGTPVVAANLAVDATTENGNNMLGGAAALGGAAGAGSFGVVVSNDTTDAYVGDQANETSSTLLKLTGSLSVQGTMTDNFNSLVISGAGGGGTGIAGMANVLVDTNKTTSGLYLVDVGQTGAETTSTGSITNPSTGVYAQTVTNEFGGNASLLPAPTSIAVGATEAVNVAANAGAVGVGIAGAGVGAGATVIVLKSNTTAVDYNDMLNTTGAVTVDATSTKTLQATALSLGAGGSVGIGASALLILVGSAPSGGLDSINSELNANGSGTLSSVSNAGMNSTSGAASDPSAGSTASPAYSVSNTINNSATDAISATVEGGSVTAGTLNVAATGNIATSSIVGGVGLSFTLGVGGGVGYTLIYDTVTASTYGGVFQANDISVQALAQDATPALANFPGTANVLAIAGGAGLVGLGAAYANGTVDDSVTASVGGTLETNPNLQLAANSCASGAASCLSVTGADTASITIGAYGAELGAAAIGVVVGQAEKTSVVNATVLDGGVVSGFGDTSVMASQSGVVSATTVGAAGGLFIAGTGAASTAKTLSQVTASTGANVTLPDGDFSLIATNDPTDDTSALGVAAGGLFAAGVGVAQSYAGGGATSGTIDPTQSTYTAATLGAGAVTDQARTGALKIEANSTSNVAALGTAGAGGGLAGAAAVGQTYDTASTVVTLNQPTNTLYAGAVTLSAEHLTMFAGQSNSIAVSVVGGSGSQTNNNVYATTSTTIAANSIIDALEAVSISASDSLREDVMGDAAAGAGGGVLTGSASLVDSSFTVNADVTLGSGVQIASGTDPVLNPGAIAIGAGILVYVGDVATLNTGGLIDGASAQNTLTLNPTTDVELGANDKLYSQGALGVGSYVQVAQAAPDSYSNTYGLAAIGNASSDSTITSSQTTHIGQGDNINGLGSVWVTAGLDPSGSVPTIINSAPDAEAYAYGLIGIPLVTSDATLTSNTTFTVDSLASIKSALNVTLGGYPGAPLASPTATGSGDILGIPTSTGTATPSTSTSSAVTFNGSALAGEYNTLVINVDPTQCGSNGSCPTNEVSGFPTTISYNPSEDLVSLVLANFPTDPAQAAALASVPTIPAPTVTLGTLYAAGGLVYVNASSLSGSGTLTANGGPTITVLNPSNAFLVVGPIFIPDQAGGSVIFTGAASGQSDPSLTLHTAPGNVADVLISSTGKGKTGGVAPGMIFTGSITAVTGDIRLNNDNGSIAVAQSVIGLSDTVTAPNGIVVVGSGNVPQYLAGNPFSEWDASILWPGGNPGLVTPNADAAIAYAANAINPNTSQYGYDEFLIGKADGGSSHSGVGSGTFNYNYSSQVWYGNCGPAAYGNCSGSGYAIDSNGYTFPSVPVVPTSITVNTVPNTAAFTNASGGFIARQITIQGSFIALGGNLVLGSPTTVAIDIPASEDAALSNLKTNGAGKTFVLTTDVNGDAQLSYDSANNQLELANVSAASNASQILLDGKILGVNPDAKISVNTGLGAIAVTNESGVALTIANLNSGSVATNLTSTVQIIDTLSQTNNVYRYTTGLGLQHLETSNLTMYCSVGADCTNGAPIINTNSATFTPLANSELTWDLTANLSRTVSTDGPTTDWSFVDPPLTTNPWIYAGSGNGNPAASLITGSSADPAFRETITASENSEFAEGIIYHGCSGSSCHYGFPSNSTQTDSKGGNTWLFQYPTAVSLDLKVTVRADYAFGIDFGGSTTGSISVTSNSPLTVAGSLFNPNGTTTLTSSGAAPQSASTLGLVSTLPNGIYVSTGAQIQAGTLVLSTTGPIGTSALPVPVTMTQAPGGAFGTLSATAGSDGIYLDVNSGATIGQISAETGSAYGDVQINSQFGLAATGTKPSITGRDIALNVVSGAVGSSVTPITLDPNGTGGPSGGVVNITALGDIDIERDNGDLLVGTIKSIGGDVSIAIPSGSLLDAAGQTPLSVLSATQVSAVQTQLGLSAAGEKGASVYANTVNPTQATANGYYGRYWNLVSTLIPNGTITGTPYTSTSNFTLSTTPQVLAVYTPLAQAAANAAARAQGVTPATVTTADVQAYAKSLYENIVTIYAPTFVQDYGANWRTLAAFTTDTRAPTVFTNSQISAFEVDPNISAAGLLNSAVSYNALQPAGSTVVGIGAPNVIGRDVTVTESQTVGKLGTPIDIPFADILNGTLSTPQSLALALATTPGQAAFLVQPATGPAISIPITQLSRNTGGQYFYTSPGHAPVAVTVTAVRIQEPAPLFLATSGKVNINTAGSVFVESTIPTLPIGDINAHGVVSITAPQSIVSGLGVGQTNITTTGGGVNLAVSTGSIGSAALPLTLSVSNAPTATGALASVSAGQDAYISFVGGDLTLGSVFAGGLASLKSTGGIFADTSGLSIIATNIALNAQGNIGGILTRLLVQDGASGALSGSTQGDAYLYSPTEPNQASVTFNVSNFTSRLDMVLGADGSVNAHGITASAGALTVSSGANTSVMNGASEGAMTLTSVANMTVGDLATTGAGSLIDLTTGALGTLTFTAGTFVTSDGGVTGLSDAMVFGGNDTMTAAGAISLTSLGAFSSGGGDTIQAGTSIAVMGRSVALGASDSFTAGSTFALTAAQGIKGGTSDTFAAQTGITVTAATVALGDKLKATTTGGTLVFTSTVGTFSLGLFDVLTAPTVSVIAKGLLNVTSGDMITAKTTDVSLTSAAMVLGSQINVMATRNVNMTSTGAITGSGAIALTSYNGAIAVTGSSVTLGQSFAAQAPLAVAITASSGALSLGGSENLRGQSLTLIAHGGLNLGASAMLTSTSGALKLTGVALTLGSNDTLKSASELDVIGSSTVTAQGAATLTSTSGQLNVTGQSVAFTGPLYATAYGPMTLTATAGALQIGANSRINAYNTLVFGAPGGLTVGGGSLIVVGSNFSWTSYQPASFGASDRITVGGGVTGKSTTLTFGSGSSLTANGAINLSTTGGGMILGALQSNQGGGEAIVLTSASTIYGNGDGQTNLTTNGGSADVMLSAGSDIGSAGLALSMKTNSLHATGKSNMWLRTIGNLLTRKTTAPGTIIINGQKVASN